MTDAAKSRADLILKTTKIEWPNAFDPAGWDGVLRTFNAKGYGLIFVDADGIVRGNGIHERDVERLLEKYGAKGGKPASAPAAPAKP